MASQAGSSNLNVNQMSYISVRKNAVVFSVADNVPLSSYVDALSSSIPPNSITHASRISNGRAAVYLCSKEIADESILCGLHIQETYVEISPLVRPTTRLVLSNVYPEIPNYVITANLSAFCKTVSPVRPIPLGMKDKKLSHIMSFRRQVHVFIKPNTTIPDHINFNHAGVNYRIFISTESVKCFSCGEYGHISKHCKKNTSQPDDNQPTDPSPETTHNPLNPPPVFHHGKKSDPKHPSKQSKTNIKHTTPARSDSATPVFSNNVSQPLNPSDPTTSNTNDPPSLSPTAPPPPASQPPPTSPFPPPSSPHPPPTSSHPSPASPHPPTLNTHSPSSPTTATPSTTRSDKPHSSKYIWGTPPPLQRDNSTPLFSEVLSKRKKKHSPPSSTQTINSSLVPLKSPSPPRKMYKHLETVKDQPTITDPPTLSQALDDSSQMSIDDPSASESDSDIQSVTSEATEEDFCDLVTTKGPLSNADLTTFLRCVKARRKPLEIARKFTNDLPGLVKQLKPLRNTPLFNKNMQQRVRKLIKTLDPNDPSQIL